MNAPLFIGDSVQAIKLSYMGLSNFHSALIFFKTAIWFIAQNFEINLKIVNHWNGEMSK